MYTDSSMSNTVDHHASYHYTSSPTAPPPPSSNMSGSSHTRTHAHLREPEYPSSDSSMRSSMGGYPYGNTSSPTHPSNLSQPILPQSQPQPQPTTYSPPQAAYQESDDVYYRAVFRELGFGESNDGQAFPAVSGCALTMPPGEFISMSNSSQQQNVAGYHETPSTHSTSHGGYTHTNGHSSRHYHPYPSPSYTSHSSHSGYSSLAAR